MLLEQLNFEPRHEPLRQLTNVPSPVHKLLPFVGIEERKLGSYVCRGICATEVEVRNGRSPGVDISGQQAGSLHQCVDKTALARFDLANHGNAAGDAVE